MTLNLKNLLPEPENLHARMPYRGSRLGKPQFAAWKKDVPLKIE
jgi:hypothetical protein